MAAELASTKLNSEQHLILDQPLLKVPAEISRKNFRSAHRIIERERDQVLGCLKSTAAACLSAQSSLQNPAAAEASTGKTLQSLDSMISRMDNLKRKLSTLHNEETQNHKAARSRIEHLQDLHDIPSIADVKYDDWSKIRLNRLLVDYLLRHGYEDSAKVFADDMNIRELVDIDEFVACSRIERNLKEGKTVEALAWCGENKGSLKKMGSDLEFELRLQQFIELVRSRQTSKLFEAAVHARKFLTSQPDPTNAIQAAGLLAYPPETAIEPYKSLYSPERWNHLASLFVRTHHNLFSLPSLPALHVALSAGLSALKTPSCHSVHAASSGNASTATSGTSVCPICSTELNSLARNVPYAHHAKSSVENDPVVLPNGRIYGRERLLMLNEKMAGGIAAGGGGTESGKVRDPMNPAVEYDWSEVKKVYIS